ncbi:DHA2 family efflux MFS transporter permease subunit [Aureimonas phyllosphaerae]|uniref:DHA2 family multidrug resistance protein n=1 Tax=Aureimonas phyllosphaerae TaxID=1166078 RepID=A0A7W6BLF2_9HYPH|nr:DHA2 family efflux MFS transporter permease subunit [Aureimonas phyllosphaerae]MBB3934144.1 DHA2 family multidrug resistance protein [Aureimonas phyllosphaerae]MBB3958640.1 DHA2 family multidrug resistance protein [Aureimonas phyllosphaerae]SFF00024.1 MFS transporter, DHA2 family, multidrug resistance protein [Aureimonas phyllosphaerae]
MPAATAAPAKTAGAGNPWVIAIVVSIATFMEVLDTTIANVALRYISGGLGVSSDEASWVVTTYLVSNAITLTASSFIAKRYGRKRFYLACLAVFTISSVLCGLAWNIESLLFFRILQGFAGGGMVPISQSILADSFPPEKRGQAFALFGVAVVVAPVVGPTLGGWLSDNVSWHWCFLINGPVGVLAFALVWFLVTESDEARQERETIRKKGIRFDLVGFLAVATFLGALELVLDRGQTEDWFGSNFIIISATVCVLAFLFMIPWELRHENPVVDLRMIASRQFGSCFLVMMATGAILIATTQFVPELLQSFYGYTATWAGLALSPGGIVTMTMMFVVGRVTAVVQPKYLIALGAAIVAAAMWDLTRLSPDVNFGYFVWSRIFVGLGLPLIFIPITTASYDGIPKNKTDQASALINVARNVGGSIGVSIAQNTLAFREQFHQSRLVEHITPSSPAYHQTMEATVAMLRARGLSASEAEQGAIALIGQTLQQQVGYLAYIDVFHVLMLISLCAVPLALILRNVKGGGGAPAGAH